MLILFFSKHIFCFIDNVHSNWRSKILERAVFKINLTSSPESDFQLQRYLISSA